MQQDNCQNNIITIIGKIASDKTFSHEVFGEGFYSFMVEAERLSDTSDILPVTISERIIEGDQFTIGRRVRINGQIRSYNSYVENERRNRLVLTIFVRDFEILNDECESNCEKTAVSDEAFVGDEAILERAKAFRSPNDVFLDGYICKPPVYRTTPFGREIADLLIAVNRSYNKSDYIPCISWGRNARFSSRLAVGDNIKIWGRMQSRGYQKKMEDGTSVEKTAYEVSVSKLELGESAKEDTFD